MPRPIILSVFCCSPRASVLFGSIRRLRRNAGCRFDWFRWMPFSTTLRERWFIWVDNRNNNVVHFIFRFYSLARRNMHRLLATEPKSSDFFWESDSACFSSHSARALWIKVFNGRFTIMYQLKIAYQRSNFGLIGAACDLRQLMLEVAGRGWRLAVSAGGRNLCVKMYPSCVTN